jgi:glycosyltransferase involved in cell wall biosynthesis
LLETLAARFFSAVVPATPTISRRFASLRQPRVVVSNYPVLEEFHAAAPVAWTCRSPAIGYVGVLSRDRGIAEITQALSLLSPSCQVTLKLAGTFSPPSFREQLAVLNGWGQTQVLGTLDRAGVVDMLSEVRAGLVVLKPTPAFLDSVPIKMFEYMCAGIPVIASNFPGFAKIMNEERCGLLVDPHDPRTIAQAIEFVLAHPEEAEEMGRRGREAVVAKYNWAGEERKLIQLYRRLLDSPCVA